jgi:hypothetical protein
MTDKKNLLVMIAGVAIIRTLPSCDDLRRRPWKGSPCPVAGHCYVASEALWHALGGAASEWRPKVVRHEGATHWYLESAEDGLVLDLTGSQFYRMPPYHKGRGCGFLTKAPSKRARILMERAGLAGDGAA